MADSQIAIRFWQSPFSGKPRAPHFYQHKDSFSRQQSRTWARARCTSTRPIKANAMNSFEMVVTLINQQLIINGLGRDGPAGGWHAHGS